VIDVGASRDRKANLAVLLGRHRVIDAVGFGSGVDGVHGAGQAKRVRVVKF
jgi:hypothetical protein